MSTGAGSGPGSGSGPGPGGSKSLRPLPAEPTHARLLSRAAGDQLHKGRGELRYWNTGFVGPMDPLRCGVPVRAVYACPPQRGIAILRVWVRRGGAADFSNRPCRPVPARARTLGLCRSHTGTTWPPHRGLWGHHTGLWATPQARTPPGPVSVNIGAGVRKSRFLVVF